MNEISSEWSLYRKNKDKSGLKRMYLSWDKPFEFVVTREKSSSGFTEDEVCPVAKDVTTTIILFPGESIYLRSAIKDS